MHSAEFSCSLMSDTSCQDGVTSTSGNSDFTQTIEGNWKNRAVFLWKNADKVLFCNIFIPITALRSGPWGWLWPECGFPILEPLGWRHYIQFMHSLAKEQQQFSLLFMINQQPNWDKMIFLKVFFTLTRSVWLHCTALHCGGGCVTEAIHCTVLSSIFILRKKKFPVRRNYCCEICL